MGPSASQPHRNSLGSETVAIRPGLELIMNSFLACKIYKEPADMGPYDVCSVVAGVFCFLFYLVGNGIAIFFSSSFMLAINYSIVNQELLFPYFPYLFQACYPPTALSTCL